MNKSLILSAIFLFIGACGGDGGPSTGRNNNSPLVAGEARYRVTFQSTWSAATHPTLIPANPHFSPLVGSVHNSDVSLWSLGGQATPGIEEMAESGSTTTLVAENALILANGDSLSTLEGTGLPSSPGSTQLEFIVSPDFPLVTLVSMLAPSPDWFVGVSGLSLLDNGDWIDGITIDLRVYDAGTDDGLTFVSGNADSSPQQAITRLTSDASDSDFVNGEAPIGQFIFERIE